MAPRSKQVPCLRCASQVWADRENWEMILQGQCCGQQYGSSRVSDANMGHGFELQALGFCLCIAKSPSPPRPPQSVSLAFLWTDPPDLLAEGSES